VGAAVDDAFCAEAARQIFLSHSKKKAKG